MGNTRFFVEYLSPMCTKAFALRPGRSQNVVLFRDYSRVFGHSGPIGLRAVWTVFCTGVPCTLIYI